MVVDVTLSNNNSESVTLRCTDIQRAITRKVSVVSRANTARTSPDVRIHDLGRLERKITLEGYIVGMSISDLTTKELALRDIVVESFRYTNADATKSNLVELVVRGTTYWGAITDYKPKWREESPLMCTFSLSFAEGQK